MESIFVYSIGVKPICLFCLTGVLGMKWVKSVLNRSAAVCLAGLNLKILDKG